MMKKIIYSGVMICGCLLLAFFYKEKVSKIYYDNNIPSREEYIQRKAKTELSLNHIMTVGFYSKDKLSQLEALKDELMYLKKVGTVYEK